MSYDACLCGVDSSLLICFAIPQANLGFYKDLYATKNSSCSLIEIYCYLGTYPQEWPLTFEKAFIAGC